jgi:bile acid:Na+ symporter, BASS family
MSLTTLIPLLIMISIMLSVIAIGLKATLKDTTHLLSRPALLVRALFSMNVIMPAVAVIIALTFNLNPAVKIALVALSVSPIPPILPNKMLKAGGSYAYTIGLLVAASLLSVILIPLTMSVFESISGIPMQMVPMDVFKVVLTSILIPLLIGIGIHAISESFAEKIVRPVALVGLILLVLSVIPVLFTSIRAILSFVGDGTLLALTTFAIIGLIVGHLLGGPDPESRPVLALASSARHPAVALAIAHANFPNQKPAAALVLIYLVLSAILAVPYLTWHKKLHHASPSSEKQVA